MAISRREKLAANGMLLTAALLWGSSYAVRKMAVPYAEPLFFNGLRYFIGFLAVFTAYLIHSFARKGGRTEGAPLGSAAYRSVGWQIAGGLLIGVVFSMGTNLQQIGLVTSDAGKCGFITALYIIIIPMISRLVLKKQIAVKIWIGAAVALPGLFFVSVGDSFDIVTGDALFLVAAFFFAAQTILVGHYVIRANALLLSSMSLLSNSALSLALSLLFESRIRSANLVMALGPAIYTGLFTVGAAAVLQFTAQKKATPSVAAIIMSFESVFGAVFAAILLNEHMTLPQIAGCVLIFFAIIISQLEYGRTIKR